MIGKGKPAGKLYPTSCSMKKSARRDREKLDDVIVIDDDEDDLSSDVVVIDIPDSLHDESEDPRVKRRQGNCVFEDVISIDDDDDTDHGESSISSQPGNSVEGTGDLDSDAKSDRTFCSAGRYSWRTSWLRPDEFRVTMERGSTSKSKKCRRTSSKSKKCRRTSSKSSFCRNRYGLTSEPESSSSDSECSDCEILEDLRGEVRKKWEQASRKRRNQVGSDDQGSASGSPYDICKNGELGSKSAQHPEATVCSNSSDSSCNKEKPATSAETSNYKFRASFLDPEEPTPMEFDQREREFSSTRFQYVRSKNMPTCTKENSPSDEKTCGESLFSDGQRESHIHEMKVSSDQCTEDQSLEQSSRGPNHNYDANGNSTYTTSSVTDKEPNITRQSHTDDMKSNLDDYFDKKFPGHGGEGDALLKRKHTNTIPVECDGVNYTDNEGTYSMPSGCRTPSDSRLNYKNTNSTNTDNDGCGQPPNSCLYDIHTNCSDSVEYRGYKNMCFVSNPSLGKPGSIGASKHITVDEINPGEKDIEPIIEAASALDPLCDREILQADCSVITPSARGDIINNREKLKETNEYKRAMEEEWIARQEQLRIQAEEAQRLKKRRRAESMRLLEMERRQKQRLEEIRDTQKKDEENMNLREQLRGLVRKELHLLEKKSYDMASLLRGLGIPVGHSFSPSSQEVHAAYKQAVLKFHPDRASRSDLRQQVEAEEKFKLIARMKEKLL